MNGRIRPTADLRPCLPALLAAAVLVTGCDTSTYLGRWFRWRQSDVGDYRRFPSRSIERGGPVFRFHGDPEAAALSLTYGVDGDTVRSRLSELARATGTTAMVVARGDTLLFEGYFNGYTRDSMVTSFSVAKSITSLLVGIAVEDGLIESIDAPVTRHLPELERRDPRFREITLRHLLDMRSGIAFRDHDLPWGDKPKVYYDPRLRERVLTKLEIEGPPGERWAYNSYNPVLLGLVLERVSDTTVAEFVEERLWKRVGMEFPASWSVDGTAAPMEKMESGLNARAIDFAKLGRLVLRQGRWDGARVVSREWIERSTSPEPGCELQDFRPRRICYRRGWWLHPGGDDGPRAIGAWGHLGQYLYVFPGEDIVVVRFGQETGGVSWPSVIQELVDQLD